MPRSPKWNSSTCRRRRSAITRATASRRGPSPSAPIASPFGDDLAAQHLAPIGAGRDQPVVRTDAPIACGIRALRRTPLLHVPRRLEQDLTHLDDRLVRGAEMLLGAVDDGTHALLQREVLGVDALDAGERRGLLLGAVDQIVVI